MNKAAGRRKKRGSGAFATVVDADAIFQSVALKCGVNRRSSLPTDVLVLLLNVVISNQGAPERQSDVETTPHT